MLYIFSYFVNDRHEMMHLFYSLIPGFHLVHWGEGEVGRLRIRAGQQGYPEHESGTLQGTFYMDYVTDLGTG